MAKDDYFKIIYVILSELYACMKQGCKVNPDDIGYQRFGIAEGYLIKILKDLSEEGYIKGVLFRTTKGTGEHCYSGLADAEITMKGIEYLQDNSKMKKVQKVLKGVKDWVPGL